MNNVTHDSSDNDDCIAGVLIVIISIIMMIIMRIIMVMTIMITKTAT